jgi:hypothetical protein
MLPLCKVILPSNASTFFKSIFQIAAFDFYDMTDIINSLLNLQPTKPFNENFEDLGFDSLYFLNNMGTMIFFWIIYPVFLLVERVISICKNCSLCCVKLHSSLRRSLYYNALLTMIFESYSLIVTCCLIALPVLNFETYG